MLTQEQINNLKTGDELVHTVYYNGKDDKGYIRCDFSPRYSFFVNTFAVDPGVLSLPAENHPKHDPCRLFKKGDKVKRKKEINGRLVICAEIERIYIVTEDEDSYGIVRLDDEPSLDTCHYELELVTPVEEQEPYYVGDCKDDPDCPFFYIQNKNNEINYGLLEEVARYVYDTDYTADKETVRKRAEAECKRLNAEYRKEQNHG